jgi:hypothetical protein
MASMEAEETPQSKGGTARADALTPAQRSEIARKAAQSRWTQKGPPRATHQGTLNIADVALPCFVLEDGTRVISGRGMTKAIGMKGRGQGVTRILSHKTLNPFVDKDLALAIGNPLVFAGGGPLPTQGYEAPVLVRLCEAILKARDAGELKTAQEKRYAQVCDILVRSFAKVGIIALVDEATGYQEVRDRLALQAILDRFLRQEFAAWAKRFPDEFYQHIFRLRGWDWRGMKVNRPQVVASYTKDLVYARLAPGILKELENRNPKDEKGHRKAKHHQWLTEEVGHPALAQHLYAVIGLMRLADSWDQFKRMIDRAYPKRGDSLQLPLFADMAS